MDNNKKYIAILVIFFGLLFLAVIIYFVFFNKPESEPAPAPAQEQQETTQPAAQLPKEEARPVKVEPQVAVPKRTFGQEDLKILAASFAERFGSFSNQSDYGNIRDLKIFMSAKMGVWADDYIQKEIAKKTDTSIYYGITTKAIAKTVEKWDEGSGAASVRVSTQRRESTGAAANAASFSQDILVNFVKEAGAWKVDSAYWQAR